MSRRTRRKWYNFRDLRPSTTTSREAEKKAKQTYGGIASIFQTSQSGPNYVGSSAIRHRGVPRTRSQDGGAIPVQSRPDQSPSPRCGVLLLSSGTTASGHGRRAALVTGRPDCAELSDWTGTAFSPSDRGRGGHAPPRSRAPIRPIRCPSQTPRTRPCVVCTWTGKQDVKVSRWHVLGVQPKRQNVRRKQRSTRRANR